MMSCAARIHTSPRTLLGPFPSYVDRRKDPTKRYPPMKLNRHVPVRCDKKIDESDDYEMEYVWGVGGHFHEHWVVSSPVRLTSFLGQVFPAKTRRNLRLGGLAGSRLEPEIMRYY
ncbi:hypothetical protein CRG98_035396 [Punica granatum]|uniref:Uncharacterized protein n=1 Tax=Punica granatum TaxID=22663 RepID=A0A2I0IKE5_PUNGR|nr:hypothetical protein CRG98_035396 [Punica granatum]